MITAIIIDDEVSQRNVIRNLLKIKYENIKIVAEADGVQSGIEALIQYEPKLVFLDIELSDGNGFDILKQISNIKFKLIFITGFKDFAIKAFKFSALDYVLKPVNSIEFENAVNRAIKEINLENQKIQLDAFLANFKDFNKEYKKIILKTQDSIHLTNVTDIIRCQSDNSYITFFLTNRKKIVISAALKEYDDLLLKSGFFRVHQSHLINTKYISHYDKREGGYIVMSDNSNIPLARRKKQQFFDFLDKLGI